MFDWTVWRLLKYSVCVCAMYTSAFNSMYSSCPIVLITSPQYFQHHIVVTHATLFSSCAIFWKSFNGNEDIHKPKTHCTRHYIQTEQNKATTKKATLSDTILSPSSMPSNWREYPRHFPLECLSIEFERANEDKRENVVLESHYVTIELCASIKTGWTQTKKRDRERRKRNSMWNEWTSKPEKLDTQGSKRIHIDKVYFDRWFFVAVVIHSHSFSFYVFPKQKYLHYWEYNAWINIKTIWLRYLRIRSAFPFFVLSSQLPFVSPAPRLQPNQSFFSFYRFSFNKCAKFNAIRLSLSLSIYICFNLARFSNNALRIKPMTVDIMTENIKKGMGRGDRWKKKTRDRMSSTTKIEHTNQHVILLNRMETYNVYNTYVYCCCGRNWITKNTQLSLHSKCRWMHVCVCERRECWIKTKLMRKKITEAKQRQNTKSEIKRTKQQETITMHILPRTW